MPQYTSNMDLYKVDLETDGNSTFNIMTMLNDNWDKIDSKYDEQEGRIRGNSEVVNEVKEDVGGWKIYNNITELGLTIGSETIVDICEAMPDKSELRFMKITTNPSTAYPMASGILNIRKYSSYRTEVRFVWGYDNKTKEWIGYYDTNIEPNFSGWKCIEEKLADIANVIVASGTGTAITLSMPSVTVYTANMKLTFIASADNSGGATTIDINSLGAKNLYKANTTIAPNLKSGKPYTVWYNGTHFFLQASAEGNAVAGDVLARKTFSNDDNTGIVGIIDLSNLNANNVKEGVSINGVLGNVKPSYFATGSLGCIFQPYTGKEYNVSGLKFRPKIVITREELEGSTSCYMDNVMENYEVNFPNDNLQVSYAGGYNHASARNITDDGFTIDTSRSQHDGSKYSDVKWIAIG